MARELAVAAALVIACARDDGQKAEPMAARPAAAAAAAASYRVDVAPPAACVHGTACEARLVLVALGDFKVNAEYPFKFVGDATPGLAFEGTGSFAHGGAKTGTLTIRFRPAAAGTAQVAGTFKLSVCTADVCEIEAEKIAFDVAVR